MDEFEPESHSFVVRLWLEDDEPVTWRGHVTHVPGGERRQVKRLRDITDFIALCLREAGVPVGRLASVRRRLGRWRRRKDV